MGLSKRCSGVLVDDTPLQGQKIGIVGQAIDPGVVPLAATGLIKDRRRRKDVTDLRKQKPPVLQTLF